MKEFKESSNAKVDSLVSDFRRLENEKMDYLVNEINILKTRVLFLFVFNGAGVTKRK